MLDVKQIKILCLETEYPMLEDDTYEMVANSYDNLYEACYCICLMKANDTDVKVGSISVSNSRAFWNNLGKSFYKKFLRTRVGGGNSLTGMTYSRGDEIE